MINSASFLTDVFFAFFGAVTGRHFGEYPPGYPVIGGVLLIGGLLLLAVLASLLARKIKMPLPPEEREGSGSFDDKDRERGDDGTAGRDENEENGESRESSRTGENNGGGECGGSKAATAAPHTPENHGDAPENRAPRGDAEPRTGDRPDGGRTNGV